MPHSSISSLRKSALFRTFFTRLCSMKWVFVQLFDGMSTDSLQEAGSMQLSSCRRTWDACPQTPRSPYFALFKSV